MGVKSWGQIFQKVQKVPTNKGDNEFLLEIPLISTNDKISHFIKNGFFYNFDLAVL